MMLTLIVRANSVRFRSSLTGSTYRTRSGVAVFHEKNLRLFFQLVKSRISARIRHNSNRIITLSDDRIFIEVGFVRRVFVIRSRPAFTKGDLRV
jgi:hypothetical protein